MMDRLLNFFSVRLIGLILVSTVKKSSADCSKNNTIDENDRIEFKGLAGHLTSPGYPAYFKDTIQCTWHIYVNMRHSIELEFEFFDFGPTEACSSKETESQFIEVRDVPSYRIFLQLSSCKKPLSIHQIGVFGGSFNKLTRFKRL